MTDLCAMNAEAAVSDKWLQKVYKRCDKQCHKCDQCREFEALVRQIDLEERSALDRQRDAEKHVRARPE
jgi:hypothetical protein